MKIYTVTPAGSKRGWDFAAASSCDAICAALVHLEKMHGVWYVPRGLSAKVKGNA